MKDRTSVAVLLAGSRHDYVQLARPLLKALEATQDFQLDVVSDGGGPPLQSQVLLAASDVALLPGHASQLANFVRGGGGLVLLHGTLAAWVEGGELAELARWTPSGPTPLTELIIRPDASHAVVSRIGELKVRDELYLSEGPPHDVSVLLRASWRYSDQVVAYERSVGNGRFVHLGLGHDPSTYEAQGFQKLVQRTLMFAAGRGAAPSTGVGLIGYGAIAQAHATAIAATPGLSLAGVAD